MGGRSSKNLGLITVSGLAFVILLVLVLLNDLAWYFPVLLAVIIAPQVWTFFKANVEDSGATVLSETVKSSEGSEEREKKPSEEESQKVELNLGSIGGRDYDRHVLLVEDNKDYQQVTILLLKNMGLDVDTAQNGKVAFQTAQEKRYDLILMDMNMPTMGGVESTQLIRHAKGPNMATPIIALTSNSDNYNRDKCYEAGMNSFLAKSCSIEEMVEELDLVFEQTTMDVGEGKDHS
jgi:CheY-like chemotaxis protein